MAIVQTPLHEFVVIWEWIRPPDCLKPVYQEWLALIYLLSANAIIDKKVLFNLAFI